MSTPGVEEALAQAYRREWAQVLATVVRLTRDLDAAQDAVQEAFAAALPAWRARGVPANPGAWLTTAARRKAVSAHRRADVLPPMIVVDEPGDAFPDDRLRLVFTCCHPALDVPARVALTLNVVCGLPTADIARLFLVPAATMAARVTRAKKKIRMAGIPYRIPGPEELGERLPAVLSVVYLLYAQGHTPARGAALTAADVAERAVDLARMLVALLPDEPETRGLLALLLLTDARRPARVDAAGAPVLLADQDRSLWDADAIAEGSALVAGLPPGPYALQAAIAAVHAAAPRSADTDWAAIVRLYDALLRVHPSPVAALARTMAYAEVAGPAAALDALEVVAADARLAGYHVLPAARADLLARLGRVAEAAAVYAVAADLAGNAAEAAYLRGRSAGLAADTSGRTEGMSDQRPLEETPQAAAAVEDETTVPQLVTGGGPDADSPEFVAPGDDASGDFVIGESDGPDDGVAARTGAEQPWDPEDLAVAEGRDPTPRNVERAARELADEGPAAIEKTVP